VATHSLIDVALRCYPKWWNERYGHEMRAVVNDLELEGRSKNAIAMSLMRDAIRSRLLARGMPRTYGMLANCTRTSVAAATIPWLAVVPFVVFITGRMVVSSSAGLVQVGYPFQLSGFRTRVVTETGQRWVHPSISATSWLIGGSSMAIDAMYVLTLGILAVGLGALRYGIKREKDTNRRWMYQLTWTPVYTILTILALYILQRYLSWHSQFLGDNGAFTWVGGHSSLAAFVGHLEWAALIGGWLLSMFGLAVVANRVTIPPDSLRFGRTVSVLTSISLTLTFIAFVVWGVAIDVQSHQSHVAGAVVATYPLHYLWTTIAIALCLAWVVSVIGATNARRSWRIIYTQRLWDS
jgi:hypothetical protein